MKNSILFILAILCLGANAYSQTIENMQIPISRVDFF